MNSNKRIAKNTLLLYIRMLIILIISLYTSREILSVLGTDDFGIYNVVGGVVILFSFLTNAMTSSTQRFLNYNLGLNDEIKIHKVFNTALITHFTIFILVLILAETIGLWFVRTQLNIPADRTTATLWVYQMSVFTTLVNIMVIPYRASIIATEKMSIFAYVSILEAYLKLIIALILPYITADKLVSYVVLLSLVSVMNFMIYEEVCRRKLSFTRFCLHWDKAQFKEQISFSGWYLFGGLAMVGSRQGTNILINIFFNVAVNAAVGIANQVRNAVYGFITSFQTAFNPPIVKLYAVREFGELLKLIYSSSRYSYFLLFTLSFPIILFCKEILSIWLVDVPKYAVSFTQLVMMESFTEALSAPLCTAIGATGKIKKYQLIVSLIILLSLPLIYISLKLGSNPIIAFLINLIISIVALLYRLWYTKKYIPYSFQDYYSQVIFPCLKITFLSIPIPIILKYYFCESTMSTLLILALSILISVIAIYLIGLNKNERLFITNNLAKMLKKH